MAADNKVHVVLINPAGNLVHRQANYDPTNGSVGLENSVKSALEVVGVWVVRDLNGDAGGPFWDEYSGNSQYKVEEAFDGVQVAKRDLAGQTLGVKVKSHFSDASSPTGFVTMDAKLEDSVMGGGASYAVLDDGQGSLYEEKLAAAKTLVGAPGA